MLERTGTPCARGGSYRLPIIVSHLPRAGGRLSWTHVADEEFALLRPIPVVFARRALSGAVLAALLAAGAPVLAQQQAPAAATARGAVPATTGVVPVGDVSAVPAPTIAARAWIVIDVNNGQLLAASNPDQKVEPASLTKIMTAYVVFNALEESA